MDQKPVGAKRPVFEHTLPFDWTGVHARVKAAYPSIQPGKGRQL